MNKERPKSGVIHFKSQREITEERHNKTQAQYRKLQENVKKMLKKNNELLHSIKSESDYTDLLTKEERQKIFELEQEIDRIYAAARERHIAKGK
ncbi:hypothetical protein [Fictibacillus arsenicus]|uniref:Uncharacterized protein n=1 Tax=Fictibacillus arsenicus TaxID=255247 RepID=A0A1V3GB93_9BACL|nr:hypothetical protein [Fictibacillus arsenicus]OOE14058.1 hypothetical protein UN64_02260 [Fictibacillus arsenicus]